MSTEPPLCPGCNTSDRLEHYPHEDLYFCLRCQSWTSAIPINARKAQEPAPVPEKPKRGRKRKGASGE